MVARAIRRSFFGVACISCILGVSFEAAAYEVGFGVSAGGLAVGSVPRFSVAPNVSFALQGGSGLRLAAHEMFGILPHPRGAGIFSQTALEVGWSWEKLDASFGPSAAIYTMPVCTPNFCRRVEGIAPGIHAQLNMIVAGPLGLSVWAALDFHLGDSAILSRQLTGTLLAGPIVRWRL